MCGDAFLKRLKTKNTVLENRKWKIYISIISKFNVSNYEKSNNKNNRNVIVFILNCVYLIDAPPNEKINNFLCTGPFLMSNSGSERHRHACSYAFGFK